MLGPGFNEFKLFQHVTTPEDSVEKGFLTVTASTVPAMLWPRYRGAIGHKDK